MKTLVFGCNGQLGQSLIETAPEGVVIAGFDLPEMDITDANAVTATCREEAPDLIINAAAYTAVDLAESHEALARAVNVDGPRIIATAARSLGAGLIHISTDFVFDGMSGDPYPPDGDTNPVSVYGQTKRDGELAVLEECDGTATIIRTAWLYSKTGSNFVKTMLRLMNERGELRVVADQVGTPTWSNSLAEAVWAFGNTKSSGIFHWTDAGETTWHGFATAIQEEAVSLGLLEKAIPVLPITTDQFPTAAKRPSYSVLDCSSAHEATTMRPAPWRENLRRMLTEQTHESGWRAVQDES